MPRATNRLNVRAVAKLAKPGMYADGGGLYLKVSVDPDGFRKRWLFVFQWHGRRREMGLGSARVLLGRARALADDARQMVRDGVNPIDARRAAKASVPTFGVFAEELVDSIQQGFRSATHRQQWRTTLTTYCTPIWGKQINEISTEDVLSVLKPIWLTKSETASRLRGRIERVLDAAKAKGLRSDENPARWRGHLSNLLPKRNKLARGHHAAMPYRDVPAFLDRLRLGAGLSALALEFCILAASRSGEVLGARWDEIDRDTEVWTVPAERTKAARQHRVPLTDRMISIVDKADTIRTSDYVFPGQKQGRPLSAMALQMVLRRMKVEDATVHGFRSAFRDWAGEETSFPREVAEAALAHVVGDSTERAYRRGDSLEKRRALMAAWADFVSSGAYEGGGL